MAIAHSGKKEVAEWLIKAGVLKDDKDPVARVIIDINFAQTSFVTVYVTKYAETKMFTINPPDIEDATIVLVDQSQNEI